MMMNPTDPLHALRAAFSTKYEITPVTASGAPPGTLQATKHLHLSVATTLPKSAPTHLRKAGSSATDPSAQPDGFFMLEAVYLAWSLCDTPGWEYMRRACKHGLPAGRFVSLTEQKSIVDWLRRAISALDSIVPLSGALLCVCVLIAVRLTFHHVSKKSRQRPPERRPPPPTIVCLPHLLLLHMRRRRPQRRAAPMETPQPHRHLLKGATCPMRQHNSTTIPPWPPQRATIRAWSHSCYCNAGVGNVAVVVFMYYNAGILE